MKIAITILIVLAVIIGVVLIIALFANKDYSIKRDIVINQNSKQVFDYIKFLKNQDYYSKWVMTDPGMKKIFRGTDGTVGFVYGWDGNSDAGAGEQEIVDIKEGKSTVTEIRFERPMKAVAYATTTTDSIAENQTNVTWEMRGTYYYPLNIMTLFVDGLLGKDMEKSLGMLKVNLEKQ